MRKQITLTNREVEMLEFIQTQEGQGSIPDVIHDCIRSYHKIAYVDKQYMKKTRDNIIMIPEIELTPQQKCEKAGGKVTTHNGLDVCRISQGDGAMVRYFPLDKIDQFI